MSKISYKHTNINARDWRKLSSFYQKVFQCKPVPPQRDLSGAWFDKLTNIKGAAVEGEHIALPGYPEGGPTLEIFTYTTAEGDALPINAYGFAHIAFEVDDIKAVYESVLREGGSAVGEMVEQFYPKIGKTACIIYTKDPEGNIVELVNWS